MPPHRTQDLEILGSSLKAPQYPNHSRGRTSLEFRLIVMVTRVLSARNVF